MKNKRMKNKINMNILFTDIYIFLAGGFIALSIIHLMWFNLNYVFITVLMFLLCISLSVFYRHSSEVWLV
jgi:hypothetical protein